MMAAFEQTKLKRIDSLISVIADAPVVVVLDLETTGFSREKFAEIIEIGAVKVDVKSKKVMDKFSQLVCPTNNPSIPSKITELTSITTEMVKGMPYIEQVLPDLAAFIGDLPVVCHNAQFDWMNWLVPEFLKIGQRVSNEAICTLALSKKIHAGWKSHKLSALCEHYGHSIQGHHRAWVDCKYTASIYLKMREELLQGFTEVEKSLFGEAIEESNQLSSKIGFESLNHLKIYRIKSVELKKNRGTCIYITSNLANVSYNMKTNIWRVEELKTSKSVNLGELAAAILQQSNLSIEGFCQKYQVTA